MLFCGVDPGVRTGVAFGCFSATSVMTEDMATILRSGVWETYTTGPRRSAAEEMQTAKEIANSTVMRVGLANAHYAVFGIEDFILRQVRNTGRDTLAPVRVTSHVEAAIAGLGGAKVYKFTPSSSKKVCSDVRLRHWGAWVRGAEHERDAVRQMIMAVRQVRIDQER